MKSFSENEKPKVSPAAEGREASARGKAIAFVLAEAFCFSLMTLFVRLSGDVPTLQKVFFRNAVAAVIAGVILARTPEGFKMRRDSALPLFLRCAFGTTGIVLNFWAIDRIGLSDANILNKMSPFFAIVASVFILSEIPTAIEWICVVVAFIGAALVAHPSAGGIFSVPALAGLVSGLCAGIAYTFVRKLGKSGERGPVIVFAFSLFSCLVSLPSIILQPYSMSLRQWLCLIAAGVAAAGGQLCVTYAYQHAPAREISVFDYSQVLFAAVWGMLFFGEAPDIFSILGYVIIIGTAVFKWRLVMRRHGQEAE